MNVIGKTRVHGLTEYENCVNLRSLVLNQYQRVTADYAYAAASVSHLKN